MPFQERQISQLCWLSRLCCAHYNPRTQTRNSPESEKLFYASQKRHQSTFRSSAKRQPAVTHFLSHGEPCFEQALHDLFVRMHVRFAAQYLNFRFQTGLVTEGKTVICLSYGFHFDVERQQRQFLAAFRAFSFVLMKNFVWRSKLRAFV